MEPKTAQEIEFLKRNWEQDPCWDLADTEGFEAYREELEQHQKEMELKWAIEQDEKLDRKAVELGIPGNQLLAMEFMRLEDKVKWLQEQIDKILYS